MAEQKPINRTQFARTAGVTRGAVTRALDGRLGAALVGTKIDVNHSEAVAYLDKHAALTAARKARDEKAGVTIENESKVEKYLDLSLREIIAFFGSDIEFIDWLKAAKILEDVKEKRIKNELSLDNLIPRDFVKSHILSLIETVNVRLLHDSPRTIAARVLDAFESGETRENIEKLICDLLSIQLKNVKTRVVRSLRK